MQYTLGGGQGAPICSTLQLSRYFKMLSWSYKGGFFGNYLCVGKMVASIAQGRRKRHPCAQSARRQRPCCRLFRRCISSSKMNMTLTQVALVARPCAPAAQLTDDSSRIKHHLPKLRSDSFQKLRMLRNRFYLISSLHFELFIPMGLSKKKWGSPNYFKFTSEFKSAKI